MYTGVFPFKSGVKTVPETALNRRHAVLPQWRTHCLKTVMNVQMIIIIIEDLYEV